MSLGIVLAVGAVGGLGAVARFVLDGTFGRTGWDFPFGTFTVNMLGAFILGVLAGAALTQNEYRVWGTGFIGAFTTFSTWMLETHRLAEDGEARVGWLNFLVSLILGLGAVWLGRQIGGWM
jgi:CrcB protein